MSRQRREQRVLDAGAGRGRTLPYLQALILQMLSLAEPCRRQAGLGSWAPAPVAFPGAPWWRGTVPCVPSALWAPLHRASVRPGGSGLVEMAAAADAGKCQSPICSLPLPSPMSAGTFVRLKPYMSATKGAHRKAVLPPRLSLLIPVSWEEKASTEMGCPGSSYCTCGDGNNS